MAGDNMKSVNWPVRPRPKKEEAEFGPAKASVLICPQCQAVYHHKSWHHQSAAPLIFKEAKLIKSKLCPACQMIKEKKFEGQLILKQAPSDKKQEILNLVKNSSRRSYEMDPLDRLIEIKEIGGQIEILTTENQMAVRLAKQIKNAFGGELEIKWSHQEDTVRITWRP